MPPPSPRRCTSLMAAAFAAGSSTNAQGSPPPRVAVVVSFGHCSLHGLGRLVGWAPAQTECPPKGYRVGCFSQGEHGVAVMSELSDLMTVFGTIDEAVVADPDLTEKVAPLLPAYDHGAAGWYHGMSRWITAALPPAGRSGDGSEAGPDAVVDDSPDEPDGSDLATGAVKARTRTSRPSLRGRPVGGRPRRPAAPCSCGPRPNLAVSRAGGFTVGPMPVPGRCQHRRPGLGHPARHTRCGRYQGAAVARVSSPTPRPFRGFRNGTISSPRPWSRA